MQAAEILYPSCDMMSKKCPNKTLNDGRCIVKSNKFASRPLFCSLSALFVFLFVFAVAVAVAGVVVAILELVLSISGLPNWPIKSTGGLVSIRYCLNMTGCQAWKNANRIGKNVVKSKKKQHLSVLYRSD